jgi:hypothetical protein
MLGVPRSNQRWSPEFLRGGLLQVFRPVAAGLEGALQWPELAALTAMAEARRRERAPGAHPIEFVPARPKPRGARRRARVSLNERYDAQITLGGRVPCLPASYHDLFNAIAWAAFPNAKRLLHARQHAAFERLSADERLRRGRSREQDALTIFDEGGSVLVIDESAWGNFDPLTAAPQSPRRPIRTGREVRLVIFGHALMEHVFVEHRGVRSSALVVVYRGEQAQLSPQALLDCVDCAVAARLADPCCFKEPGLDAVAKIISNDEADAWPRHVRVEASARDVPEASFGRAQALELGVEQ